MKDRNGEELGIGDLCVCVESLEKEDVGKTVIVRAIKPRRDGKLEARIDDDLTGTDGDDNWTWSAWVQPSQIVLKQKAAASA